MSNEELLLDIICSSEKEDVSIGFGSSYNPYDNIDSTIKSIVESEWVSEGIGESFWENYFQFKPGVEKAMLLIKSNPQLSPKQALFEVFGNFYLTFQINGVEYDCEYNPNEEMYSHLINML